MAARHVAELSRFAALLLEKAAQVCEGMHEEDRPGDYAYELRAMSAALQSSDRGECERKSNLPGVRPDLALCWRAGVADSYGTRTPVLAQAGKKCGLLLARHQRCVLALAAICFWES